MKGEGGARFETIDSPADVIKLAARAGEFDLGAEFGVDAERIPALGRETQLAIGAGIDALRDAGIPLVRHYRTTSVGTQLPDRWMLPEELRDRTGVIFASAFPGYNDFADELTRFGIDAARRQELAALAAVRAKVAEADGHSPALAEIDRRIHDLQLDAGAGRLHVRPALPVPRAVDGALAVRRADRGAGAEHAGERGVRQHDAGRRARPRTGSAPAAATGSSSSPLTTSRPTDLLGWMGSGFLASGAAATDEDVEDAAVPFDRRRHGMILGMGAAAIVVERAGAARQRGIRPICEVLGAVTANSAFHGTRLDVDHIGDGHGVARRPGRGAGRRGARRWRRPWCSSRTRPTRRPAAGAPPPRSNALRRVFGDAADQVVVANTKGFTGHPMGVGIEDVVAVKALETGIVPPVPNFKEPDPDLGAAQPVDRRRVPGALRAAARRRVRLPDQHADAALGADARRPAPEPRRARLRRADRRPGGVAASGSPRVSGDADPQLEVDHRTLRVAARDAVRPSPAPAPEPVADAARRSRGPATSRRGGRRAAATAGHGGGRCSRRRRSRGPVRRPRRWRAG